MKTIPSYTLELTNTTRISQSFVPQLAYTLHMGRRVFPTPRLAVICDSDSLLDLVGTWAKLLPVLSGGGGEGGLGSSLSGSKAVSIFNGVGDPVCVCVCVFVHCALCTVHSHLSFVVVVAAAAAYYITTGGLHCSKQ